MTETRSDTSAAIDALLLEERKYPPLPAFAAQANVQPEIYDRDFEELWETEARERVSAVNARLQGELNRLRSRRS